MEDIVFRSSHRCWIDLNANLVPSCTPRSTNIVQKIDSKRHRFLMDFGIDFLSTLAPSWKPRWPQDGPQNPIALAMFASEPPRAPKTPQDSPKTAPRRPQDGPRRPRDTPKTSQDIPKTPPRPPQDAQKGADLGSNLQSESHQHHSKNLPQAKNERHKHTKQPLGSGWDIQCRVGEGQTPPERVETRNVERRNVETTHPRLDHQAQRASGILVDPYQVSCV